MIKILAADTFYSRHSYDSRTFERITTLRCREDDHLMTFGMQMIDRMAGEGRDAVQLRLEGIP